MIIYVITMLSVHKPAKIAGNVSPMEALRYVPQDGMKQTSGRKQCRNLTPAGLGIMNFSRNRKKTAITMLSLGLGGILFMTAATYMSSFSKENYARQGDFQEAEFIISYSPSAIELNENGLSGMQAETPLGDEMIGQITSIDGVEKVTERKGFGVQYDFPQHDEYGSNDIIYPLTEEEMQGIDSYVTEGTADTEALLSGEQVLVAGNDTVEEIYGWKFQTGDKVTLHYYDGSGMAEKEVEIAGMLSDAFDRDHNGIEGWFVMPEQAVLDWLSYDSINSSLLISTDSAKEASVGEQLDQIVGERPELTMETLAQRRIAYGQSADQSCHIYHDVQYPQHDEYAHHKHRDPQAGIGHAGVHRHEQRADPEDASGREPAPCRRDSGRDYDRRNSVRIYPLPYAPGDWRRLYAVQISI